MAKKKKGKLNDARGYGQSSPATRAATAAANNQKSSTSVTHQTHDGMKSLLDQMKQQEQPDSGPANSVSSGTNVGARPSDRFASRLAGIADRLTELGFSNAHVDDVVQALQYSISLETALDWLCLHLPTMELPTLFTDGRLRESLSTSMSSNNTLTVLKLSKPTVDAEKSSVLVTPPAPAAAVVESNDPPSSLSKEEEDEKAALKSRLLQQYQFVEDDDENDDDDDENDEDGIILQGNDDLELPNSSKSNISPTIAATPVAPPVSKEPTGLSPDEENLMQQEKELEELEADVNNDANNYMRTKQEIKELKAEVKRKRQAVAGLRKRIEREKAKKKAMEMEQSATVSPIAAAAAAVVEQDDDEEDGGGFVDLFGSGTGGDAEEDDDDGGDIVLPNQHVSAVPSPTEPAPPPPPPKPLIDAIIRSDWTGTTPQKTLEELCRKKKLPRPKFTKLPYGQGYTLSLTTSKGKKAEPDITTAYNSDFVKGSSLTDYLATQALYQMEPTLPLYRMFPPPFRDFWLSWLQQVEDVRAQELRLQDSQKQQRLDYLLSLIQKPDNGQEKGGDNGDSDGEVQVDSADGSSEVPEAWDDDDEPVREQTVTPKVSDQGKKLQKLFERRISTPDYKKMLQIRSSLPMTSFRQEILEVVANNAVTIVSAQTGAGKTTQCPQFLLEQALSEGRGHSTEIIVTQPRRVAATSVAERVAEEMCEPRLGELVGYQIRMEARRSAATRLLFCTTGIVLRRLQEDRNLKGITHVIVDEVHERQQQTDVLLITLRELLRTTRPDLKVILMSATLDSEMFCSYFGNAPLVSVPGRTFSVSTYNLEDLMDATNHVIEEGSRYALRNYTSSGDKATLWVTDKGGNKRREVVDLVSQTEVHEVSDLYSGYKMATRRSMDRVNEEVINYDLLEDVLSLVLCRPDDNTTLLAPDGADLSKGSVLIFLPGLGEIRSMTERLEGNRIFRDTNRFEIIPLHSTLSSKDQRRAFLPARGGCRKIILSTNIAETSVTIPDVVVVIDAGRVREVRRNKRTSTSILVTDWCSKASAKQRAGRAGRVQPGLCLKLYSSHTEKRVMKPDSEPELRRVPLEEVCLSILASGHTRSCMDFLSKAPQPPAEDSVKAAVDILQEVGAIEINEYSTSSERRIERLTPLGRNLASLPVDVRLGKMLIFGALFRCLDQVLTIAASLSSQSPFSTFVSDASVAKARQRAFCHADSDFLTFCNVWENYSEAAQKSTNAARKFCQANFLNYLALREIGDARRQFLELLCSIGFVDRSTLLATSAGTNIGSGRSNNSRTVDPSVLPRSIYNENGSQLDLLQAVICAGLYPNVAKLQPATKANPSDYIMFHQNNERLFFHNTSVNSRQKSYSHDSWVVFHEKFGTPARVSVATTCFVHPFALMLFGGSIVVRHTERKVVVDGWIEISIAAQIGVIMKELRKEVDTLLVKIFEQTGESSSTRETESVINSMIQGIVNLFLAAA